MRDSFIRKHLVLDQEVEYWTKKHDEEAACTRGAARSDDIEAGVLKLMGVSDGSAVETHPAKPKEDHAARDQRELSLAHIVSDSLRYGIVFVQSGPGDPSRSRGGGATQEVDYP